jgi:predicted acyltransferase
VAILGMILVNHPGSAGDGPAQLVHAPGNGATAADAVFPGFLFVVGASLALSKPTVGRLVRRCLLLIVVGLLLNAIFTGISPLRLPGVLQRIGLASLVAGLLMVRTSRAVQLSAIPVLLVGWWGAIEWDPDLPARVDQAVLGRSHLYRRGPLDPEGLLSTLPSVATVLLGAEAGRWLRDRKPVVGLAAAGLLAVGSALAWHEAGHPFDKRLWTSSFVLWAAGIAALVLVVAHLATLRWQGWSWPLRVLGFNALVVYVLSELLGHWLATAGHHQRIYDDVLVPAVGKWTGSLSYSLLIVAAVLVPAAVLWWRRISVRL